MKRNHLRVGDPLNVNTDPLIFLPVVQSRAEFELVVLWIGRAVGNKHGPALLRSRALLTATKLSKFLFEKYPNDIDKLLWISAEALGRDEPPPVKVAALKAFEVFLSGCPSDVSLRHRFIELKV